MGSLRSSFKLKQEICAREKGIAQAAKKDGLTLDAAMEVIVVENSENLQRLDINLTIDQNIAKERKDDDLMVALASTRIRAAKSARKTIIANHLADEETFNGAKAVVEEEIKDNYADFYRDFF